MRARVVAAAIAALLAPAVARAEQAGRPRVAVLELRIEGDAPPELRTQMEKSLDGGLFSAGFDVVSRATVAEKLAPTPNLIGCTSTTCLQRIGEIVGSDRFVRARIEASGASYSLEIHLLGSEVEGGLIVHREGTCDVCTIGEANDAMSRLAESLGDTPAPDLPVAFRSQPDGAQVKVDGTVKGRTPLDTMLAGGSHAVEARLPGHNPLAAQIEVAEQAGGGAQEVMLTLVEARAARYRIWKWAAAGAAAVALGTGIYLIAIDDSCSSSVPEGTTCPRLYDTVLSGAVLTVAGVGLAGGAVYFFWSDRNAGAGVSGSF
jgi:hypothetical protein